MRHTFITAGLMWLLTVGHPNSAAGQLPAEFEPTNVSTYSDSFAIVVQGVVRGWHRYAFEPHAQGFLYSEAFALGDLMTREVVVGLSPDLSIRFARAVGRQFGHEAGADVRYDGRHVTGWALQTNGNVTEAPRRVVVDTVLPKGAFDGLALIALLPTLDWSIGTSTS